MDTQLQTVLVLIVKQKSQIVINATKVNVGSVNWGTTWMKVDAAAAKQIAQTVKKINAIVVPKKLTMIPIT